MFELRKEMAKNVKPGDTPGVTGVFGVTPHDYRAVEPKPPGVSLVYLGVTPPKHTGYTTVTPPRNRPVRPVVNGDAPNAPNTPGHTLETAKMRPFGKPISGENRWRFLIGVPFTRTMLEVAAERWGEPLDRDDLQDIEQGGNYLFEQREVALRRYLEQWAEDNPVKFEHLTAEIYGNDVPTRS